MSGNGHWEINLRKGGTRVTESIHADTREDAERIARARNPGFQNTGFNYKYNQSESSVGSSSSRNYKTSSFSGIGSPDLGDSGGYLALGMFALGLWLIIEFWWIVIPVAVLGGIGWFLKD